MKEFPVYRGLQKPLVFKSFKGKFIYWGLGSLIAGLISFMVLASLFGLGWGLLVLVIIGGGGVGITNFLQKKGLHRKQQVKGLLYMPAQYQPKHEKAKV